MMVPGSIDENNQWVEASSLARVIEEAMVAADVINVSKESKSTTKDRRKSFVAIATALIRYLQQNMDLKIAQGDLRSTSATTQEVPPAATTLSQVVN